MSLFKSQHFTKRLLLLLVEVVFYSFKSFSHHRWLMVSHWSLNDGKSPQVSRILLNILANLNNDVVWMVSARPLISKSSSPCTNPLVTVPSAPITTGITVTCMVHSFSVIYRLIFLFASFQFYPVVSRDGKVHYSAGSLFMLTITRSVRLAEIR